MTHTMAWSISLCSYVTIVWILVAEGSEKMLNIAHRGSSGSLPEHTKEAYRRAIEEGADYIECDVTLTRDLVPVCRHESLLNHTTDVSNRAQFRDKISTYNVDGVDITGWFTVDFTLEELMEIRAVQHLEFRDQGHNGLYTISTLEEYLMIAKDAGVGIYPELKSPSMINSLPIMPRNTTFEDIVIDMLHKHGYTSRDSPCYLQSFEEQSLIYARERTGIKIIMLFWVDPAPGDLERYSNNDFDGVGAWKEQIVRFWTNENGYKNWLSNSTNFIQHCKYLGLIVHVYTFRNEDRYMAWDFKQDPYLEYAYFADLNIDGMFTDFPHSLHRFQQSYRPEPCTDSASLCTVTLWFVMAAVMVACLF